MPKIIDVTRVLEAYGLNSISNRNRSFTNGIESIIYDILQENNDTKISFTVRHNFQLCAIMFPQDNAQLFMVKFKAYLKLLPR